jgi:mono/diheme cytochrome c family protein
MTMSLLGRHDRHRIALLAALLPLGALTIVPGDSLRGETGGVFHQAKDEEASRAAFLAAYPVFMHPRCVNCHPAGDVPLQGDESRPHAQNVRRGPDGRGKYALKCGNCHQNENLPGENMPPGNSSWHLPPPETPMVFQDRSPRQLAEQLKDPRQNGGRSLADVLHHVEKDTLVTGCWEPGDGRSKPPVSHAEFVRLMRRWIDLGASAPR